MFGNREGLLFCNRLPSLLLTAATLICVYRMGCRLRGPGTGLIACLWLETMPWFVEKSIEWRPDVPAMFFLTVAASRLLEPNFRRPRWFLGGSLLGAASLCTLKVVTLGLWLAIGFGLCRWRQQRSFVFATLLGVAGGIVAWLPFLSRGLRFSALCRFSSTACSCCHFAGKPSSPFAIFYTTFPHWAPGQVALAIWGLASCWRRHWRATDWLTGPTAFAFAATMHFGMLPIVPASFLQYYLLAVADYGGGDRLFDNRSICGLECR